VKLLLILIIVQTSFAVEIVKKFIPTSGSVDATVSVSTTGSLTSGDFTANGDAVVDGNLTVSSTGTNIAPYVKIGNPYALYPLSIRQDADSPKLGLEGNASDVTLSFYESGAGAKQFAIGLDSSIDAFSISEGSGVGSADRLTIDASGDVGIGTNTPSYNLEAANGPVAGNGAYVNTSDKRLKKNSELLTGACGLVDQLTPLLYDWKSVVPSSYRTWANGFEFYDEDGNLQDGKNQVNKQKHGLKDVGFFAQDVESVFPQAVSTTSKGRYNLAYEKFIPLLVACIQEMRE